MTSTTSDSLAVLRACDDLRRGMPVLVTHRETRRLVLAMERADPVTLGRFDDLASPSDLMVTPERAESFKLGAKGWPAVRLERRADLTPVDMVAVADPTLDLARPLKGPFYRTERAPDKLDGAAIKLAKLARLLPAVLIADINSHPAGLLVAAAEPILSMDLADAVTLEEVGRARVPLEGCEDTKLVGFRPRSGGLEHFAILVGNPDPGQPILARLHSECFTGDLLASLKCDCGEQLKGAIKRLANEGGGVILYLAQEGRGIGLVSKLKAYALQDQGFDTVEANTRLGFDVDERVFAPAAEMLKALGYRSVRLMTNNPEKTEAMARFGVEVVGRIPHAFGPNPHNERYLTVKRDKTGHALGDDLSGTRDDP